MTVSDAKFERLSALVDGEATDEERCDVLADVIHDVALRDELQQLIDLRRTTARWRNSIDSPPSTETLCERSRTQETERRPSTAAPSQKWSVGGYLVATVVGGLLVCAGLLAGRLGSGGASSGEKGVPVQQSSPVERPLIVAPQQQRQAAEVFAFHESVTGPLSWFASDEDEVLLGSPMMEDVARRPAAVQLRIRDGATGREVGTWLIVCRDRTRADMELPLHDAESGPVRLSLLLNLEDSSIAASYSLVFGALTSETQRAHLSGQRNLDASAAAIGEVFFHGRRLTIDAAAWPLDAQEPQI